MQVTRLLGTAVALTGLLLAAGSSLVAGKPPDDDRAAFRRPLVVPFPVENPYTAEKAALGEKLFFDPALSGAGDRSCASCHRPDAAFSDGLPRGVAIDGTQLDRRTPSLFDLAWGQTFFWDGRSGTLEAQALMPIQDEREMHHDPIRIAAALTKAAEYRADFARAFPETPEPTPATISKALATYERTLLTRESPFDRWVMGDEAALSEAAKRGFAIFNGPAACSECHSGWALTDNGFHDIGLPGADPGRGRVLGQPELEFAFKTPSLRDVARRGGPYMHDGSLQTLEEVIDHYTKDFPKRPSLSPDLHSIRLTAEEKKDLLAFLQALDGDGDPPALTSPDITPPVQPPAKSGNPVVTQRNKDFSVRAVSLGKGEQVVVRNDDSRPHNLRVHADRMKYNSGMQQPGETVSIPFPEAGSFEVFCGIHPKMKLRVEVTPKQAN